MLLKQFFGPVVFFLSFFLCLVYSIKQKLVGQEISSSYQHKHIERSFGRAAFSKDLFSASETNSSYGKAIKQMATAQDSEDLWLYESLFYGMTNGLIIESGALDGRTFSTSYFYEKFANWTAIHIEADRQSFHSLLKNRPRSVNINAALCSTRKMLHYVEEGISTVHGIIEFMSESFLRTWHPKYYNDSSLIQTLPVVNCVPMKKLLSRYNVTEVDIWVLDVEGAEESALLGTDFRKVRFNVIIMENDGIDKQKEMRKIQILKRNGFECQRVYRNAVCKHRHYKHSSRLNKSLLKCWSFDGNCSYSNVGWIGDQGLDS